MEKKGEPIWVLTIAFIMPVGAFLYIRVAGVKVPGGGLLGTLPIVRPLCASEEGGWGNGALSRQLLRAWWELAGSCIHGYVAFPNLGGVYPS